MDQISRFPKFYKLSVSDRVRLVHERGLISKEDFVALSNGEHTLNLESADKMIENVIGVLGLPIGLGLNFLINGKDYVVPLAVEEPSIVAALSSAAKLFRRSGGFITDSDEPILIGQVQLVEVPHMAKAKATILEKKEQLIALANSFHPNMVARGGGVEDLEVLIHPAQHDGHDMLVVHFLVNTCDAMGANLVNTICEGMAPKLEELTGGRVFLRILSNLADRALVRAKVSIPAKELAFKGYSGDEVRDGIILATEFASVDPYRATTHNKGIMNGIDAVAIATGNDWRAIEASAHAYAARGGHYTSLTHWNKNDNGDLVGYLELPLKVGIVGGPLKSNPSVSVNLRMMGIERATQLAEVMCAVGLAQNFSALRALATDGIQRGHMSLHARSVAMSAGATPDIFDEVVEKLKQCADIKIWKAKEIIADINKNRKATAADKKITKEKVYATGFGKAILMGEHSVVYGRHAIGAAVPFAVQACVEEAKEGVNLVIPRWGVDQMLHEKPQAQHSFEKSLATILSSLELTDRAMRIEVKPNIARAMGLGSSAALAVAIIRALVQHYQLNLSDESINNLAFECEKHAHGTPSGIDNTIATYGRCLLYSKGEHASIESIEVPQPIKFVIGISGVEGLTAKMVAQVRMAWKKDQSRYERIFDEIDGLVKESVAAIKAHDLSTLGHLMNLNHGFLNGMGLSTWELEELIQIARESGALGAKLTGGGGGGSIIALCPDDPQKVVQAMHLAGYQAMEIQIG